MSNGRRTVDYCILLSVNECLIVMRMRCIVGHRKFRHILTLCAKLRCSVL